LAFGKSVTGAFQGNIQLFKPLVELDIVLLKPGKLLVKVGFLAFKYGNQQFCLGFIV
jgi:hypothetical protein